MLVIVLAVAGCVISPRRVVNGGTTSSPANTEFTISADPNPQTVTAGTTAIDTVTILAQNGFTGTVNLSVSSVSSGLSPSLSSSSVSGGTGAVTLTVLTSSIMQAGNATLILSGVDPATGQSQAITVTVTITP